MKSHRNFDSKFRFVIVASKRAKELLKGAKPRIKAKSRNPIRIAQSEARMGLIDYEIVKSGKEEIRAEEEHVLLAEDVASELEEEQEDLEKDTLTGEEEEEEIAEEDEELEEEEEAEEEGEEEEKD